MHAAILLAMATASLALPHDASISSKAAAPEYFTLHMSVGSGLSKHTLPLSVLQNGTQQGLYLVANSAVPLGTAAFLTGTDPMKQALQLDVSNTPYGVAVADVGDLQDVAVPVTAEADYREFEFQAIQGVIYHQLSAASNGWLACNRSIDGQNVQVLSWGSVRLDGMGPDGCVIASVYQYF